MKALHPASCLIYAQVMVAAVALGSGCSKDMQEQPSFESQEAPRKHSPMGSVPRKSRTVLSVPEKTEASQLNGSSLFAINCAHCHGATGSGDGSVAGYLKEIPANLHASRVQQKPMSEVYEIVSNGKDVMPAFRGELSVQERWAVVSFVKSFSPEPSP
jgi:mono/diheme cytochrome c family protein